MPLVVGRASKIHEMPGSLNPSMSRLQLHSTRILPSRNASSFSARIGSSPQTAAASIPRMLNASAWAFACSMSTVKHSVRRCSPSFIQTSTIWLFRLCVFTAADSSLLTKSPSFSETSARLVSVTVRYPRIGTSHLSLMACLIEYT